jgi:hypothetical protein
VEIPAIAAIKISKKYQTVILWFSNNWKKFSTIVGQEITYFINKTCSVYKKMLTFAQNINM